MNKIGADTVSKKEGKLSIRENGGMKIGRQGMKM